MVETKKQRRQRLEQVIQNYEQAIKQDIQIVKKYATIGSVGLLVVFTAWAVAKNTLLKPKNTRDLSPQEQKLTQEVAQLKTQIQQYKKENKDSFLAFLQKKIINIAIDLLKQFIAEQLQTFASKEKKEKLSSQK
ncbi:MAG: hypothetical protein NZ551_03415 [Microscillaceae bacterium]|nr:hypothetical protein [Microscillaceae bacterium]MDW8460236.1 hypothetical protein [Cytophagales bacterium]